MAQYQPLDKRSVSGLALFVLLVTGLFILGGRVSFPGVVEWYPNLAKPAATPPDWIFGPVWGGLYLLIALAGWLVWKRAGLSGGSKAFVLYGLQLALNLGWSILFFGLHLVTWALVEVIILWVAILFNLIAFCRHSRLAGWLLVPYLLWVAFAVYLNFEIWRLN